MIRTILILCISSVDQFCVLKVIGAHVDNDDIGFLTIVQSGVIVELNHTVLPHTGCAVLPEVYSTSRPGVVYKDIGAQLFCCLINPDMLCLGNLTLTADGISFRVVESLCHREPYSAARQSSICIYSCLTV